MPRSSLRSFAWVVPWLAVACGDGSTGPGGNQMTGSGVASIAVSPGAVELQALQATRQLSATARDAGGTTLPGITFEWSSSDPAVATVDADGLVTAAANGNAVIRARAGEVTGHATVAVRQVAATVTVTPAEHTFAAPGETRQFEAEAVDAGGSPVPDPDFAWSSTDEAVVTVDAEGLATAQAPGQASVRATADEAAGDASVAVQSPDRPFLLSIDADPMVEGGTATLSGGNFSPSASSNLVTVDGVEASVTAATTTELTVTVPPFDCRPPRRVEVVVSVAGSASDPFAHPLAPTEGALSLAPGERLRLTDPATYCLRFEATADAEAYLIGATSVSDVFSGRTTVLTAAVTGEAGIEASVAPSGAGGFRAARLPAGGVPRQDLDVDARRDAHRRAEMRVRAHERRLLEGRLAGERPPGPGAALSLLDGGGAVPAVGDTVTARVPDINGDDFCDDFVEVRAEVRAVGTRGIWLDDVNNPSDGFTDADYQSLSDGFDAEIYATDADYFGQPTDIDANERIRILVSGELNRMDPRILGFVFVGDFFSRTSCASSDVGEIFYGKAPDPNAELGHGYGRTSALADYPFIVAHELTHVIQQGRRIAAGDPLLSSWFLEAQATLGEEVVGHAVTGREPGQNYGFDVAFNTVDDPVDWYSNAFRDLAFYAGFDGGSGKVAGAPEECGWLWRDPSPCGGRPLWYGVGWSFLRWLSDHLGPVHPHGEAGLHRDFVDHAFTDWPMIESLTGRTRGDLQAAWGAMLYSDDRAPGVEEELELTSWNLRDVEAGLPENARLEAREIGFEEVRFSVSVRAGSTAYLRLEGSDRPPTAVRLRSGTDGTLTPDIQVWVLRLP